MSDLRRCNTLAVVIDPQKGFTPACPNELPVPEGGQIVDGVHQMLRLCTHKYVSMDSHPPHGAWVTNDPSKIGKKLENPLPNVDRYWPTHCVVGTKGHELIDGLPDTWDGVIYKGCSPTMHPYGACFHNLEWKTPHYISTGLAEMLNDPTPPLAGVEKRYRRVIIVGGLAMDYCVATTLEQLAVCFSCDTSVFLYGPATRPLVEDAGKELQTKLQQGKFGKFFHYAESIEEIIEQTEKDVCDHAMRFNRYKELL